MPIVSLETVGAIPAYVILDTLNGVSGANADTSLVASAPKVVQVEPTPAGTSVDIQARITNTGSWTSLQLVPAGTATATIINLPAQYNFVRAVRAGLGDVVVAVQD